MIMLKSKKHSAGYIAFMTLLVIAAMATALMISATQLSLSQAQNTLSEQSSLRASLLARSCAENALLRLQSNDLYTGETLNLNSGSCTIVVNQSGVNEYLLGIGAQTSAPISNTSQLQIQLAKRGTTLVILSWQLGL